jgi:regulator of protease activity HflC (stomatin/prohibitin superfamily)
MIVAGIALRAAGREVRKNDDDRTLRVYNQMKAPTRKLGGLVLAAGIVLLLFSAIVIVPSGHVAIMTIAGQVQPAPIAEGMHGKLPWADAHFMSIRRQTQRMVMNASTSTGVTVDVELSLVYRLDPVLAPHVYQTVGPEYFDILVAPFINRTAKDVFVSYGPEAIYTGDRTVVNTEIEARLAAELAPLGIIVEQAPIENIDLPQSLRDAIVAKQEAEQEALRMEYVIQAQALESDRMRIEAQGVADYQQIVSQGISEQLLAWKAIEVTAELAQSDNTTFVIIGNTENGLPMIYQTPGR